MRKFGRACAAKFLAVLLFAAAPPAVAQDSLPFVAPRVGMTIEFSDGLRMAFEATQGNRTVVMMTYPTETVPQRNVLQDTFFHAQRLSQSANLSFTIRMAPNATVWPLTIGKRIEYSYDALQSDKLIGHGKGILRVIGTERINIPAGNFEAWLVETDAETAFGDNRKVQSIQRYWYVAELGAYVMTERTITDQGRRYEPHTSYATRIQQTKQ